MSRNVSLLISELCKNKPWEYIDTYLPRWVPGYPDLPVLSLQPMMHLLKLRPIDKLRGCESRFKSQSSSDLTVLCVSFLICQKWVVIIGVSQGCWKCSFSWGTLSAICWTAQDTCSHRWPKLLQLLLTLQDEHGGYLARRFLWGDSKTVWSQTGKLKPANVDMPVFILSRSMHMETDSIGKAPEGEFILT